MKGWRWEKKIEYEKKHTGQEKRYSDDLAVARAYRPPGSLYSPKQWMYYTTNEGMET